VEEAGLSGRFDNVVYAIDTSTGEVKSVKVGSEPHGLTVWPQPGRYSLGHTATCASSSLAAPDEYCIFIGTMPDKVTLLTRL
jgi:hypothetical protein